MKASGNEGPDTLGFTFTDFKRRESKPLPQNSPQSPLGHTHSAKEVAESLEVHATAGLAAEHTHFTLSGVKTAGGLWTSGLLRLSTQGWPQFCLEPEYSLLASFFSSFTQRPVTQVASVTWEAENPWIAPGTRRELRHSTRGP